MAKNEKKRRFVISDETVPNQYGFYVATLGIKLDRFRKNPVMLADHHNNTKSVLGKWDDVQVEGAQLTALPVFDMDDQDAAMTAGKVERGFINGASAGLLFQRENLAYVSGKIVLTECELVEGTICPVPSNPNALQLYLAGSENTPLTEADIKALCLAVTPVDENINFEPDMKKILLNLSVMMALGFENAPKDGIDETELEAKILQLSTRLKTAETNVTTLTAANKALTDAQEAVQLAAATKDVNDAHKAGKIGTEQIEVFLSLYKTSPDLAKATLAAIPAKTSLSAQVTASGTTTTVATEVKTIDDFVKLSLDDQKAFKEANPDAYAKL